MLIFPLKKQWYEKIKSGEKTIEYREVKLYWIKRINKAIQEHNYEHNYTACKFHQDFPIRHKKELEEELILSGRKK